MEILKYSGITLLVISSITVFVFSVRGKKPVKTLFLNSALGIIITFLIHFTYKFTGVNIPINQYTVLGATLYGITAVCGFLIMPIIFK